MRFHTAGTAAGAREQRPGRPHGALSKGVVVVGLGCVLAAAIVAGVALHLDTPPARRIAHRAAHDALRGAVRGTVAIERVARFGLRHIEISALVVRDPRGAEVLRARNLRARHDSLAIAREVLRGRRKVAIAVTELYAELVHVALDRGASGDLTIAEALAPRHAGSRARVELEIASIEIARAEVHGAPAPGRAIDATVDRLTGSLHTGPAETRIELRQACLTERRMLPAPIEVCGGGALRLVEGRAGEAALSLTGRIGDVPLAAHGRLQAGHVQAAVELPRVTPDAAAAILERAPLHRPVAVAARVHGPLRALQGEARVDLLGGADPAAAEGSLVVRGRLDARDPREIDAEIDARGVDVRAFAPAAPEARVSGVARAAITLGAGAPRVDAEARTEPLTVDGWPVPAIEARARFEEGRLSGAAMIQEMGAPIALAVEAHRDEISIDASTQIPSLAAAPRLPRGLEGSAALRARAVLRGGALDAVVDARASRLQAGEARLGRAQLGARIRGAIPGGTAEGAREGLRVDAWLRGEHLRAAGQAFARVAASASGPIGALRLGASLEGAGRRLDAAGLLDVPALEARGIQIQAARGGARIEGRIARVTRRSDALAIEGIALEGAGRLEGTLALRRGAIEGELRGSALDLEQLSAVAGLPAGIGGLANLEVALRGAGAERQGRLLLELEGGALPGLAPLVSANVAVRLRGDAVLADGSLRLIAPPEARGTTRAAGAGSDGPSRAACAGAIARLLVERGEATLDGPLLEAGTWRRLAGSARVSALRAERLPLAALEPLVEPWIRGLDGTLDGAIRRDPGGRGGFSGRMRLRDGAAQIAALGQEITGAQADLVAGPAGELRIESVRAEARGGEILGRGVIRMEGLGIATAQGELQIPEGRDLPLWLQGLPLGRIHGRMSAVAERRGGAIALDVRVPRLRLMLPPPLRRRVQPPAPNDPSHPLNREAYVARLPARASPAAPAGAAPVVITARLGDLRIEGEDVHVALAGAEARPVRVTLDGGVQVQGDLRVLSGSVVVLGKELAIEPGLIHFHGGAPPNPDVNLSATWDAPDGTRVHIGYAGALAPVTEEKIELRSDPPLPARAVLALLLFGEPPGGAPLPIDALRRRRY